MGITRTGRLDPGTGNGNYNGTGADINACNTFFEEQKQLCIQNYGSSCKVYGFIKTREPSINNAVVTYRIYPVSNQARTSRGVCEPTFNTSNIGNPVISSGPEFIVSTNAETLKEDCEVVAYSNFWEIFTIGKQNGPTGHHPTTIQTIQLTDLETNSAIINFVRPP